MLWFNYSTKFERLPCDYLSDGCVLVMLAILMRVVAIIFVVFRSMDFNYV